MWGIPVIERVLMRRYTLFYKTLTLLILLNVTITSCGEKQISPQRMAYDAKGFLTGKEKNFKKAKELLLDVANNHVGELFPADLCYVYVYLGYIEDQSDNREKALEWFEKAAVLKGPRVKFIREVAESGLTKPITWIRHLDNESAQSDKSDKKLKILKRFGKGYVTPDWPPHISPSARKMTEKERLENFIVLHKAIDRYFSFFEHKKIDLEEIKSRYHPKVITTEDTHEYYQLLIRMIRELKDFHSWVANYISDDRVGYFRPEVSLRKIENKAIIVDVKEDSDAWKKGLRRGSVLIEVEGQSILYRIEQMRSGMKVYSSERAFIDIVYRKLLNGPEDHVRATFLLPGNSEPVILELARKTSDSEKIPEPDFDIKKGKSLWYGFHPSGFGYIRILTFKTRTGHAEEFDEALDELRDAPGLILDIRENTGGFGTGQRRMIGRLLAKKAPSIISYLRNGPDHNDFYKHDGHIKPAGPWQYTKPVALLTNSKTGSAADLFAARIFNSGRVITIGTPTHGNLTGTCVFAILPCGLNVRISAGYITDSNGKIIEGNGNVPDIIVDQTYEDLMKGRDTVLDRAVTELERKTTGN